jgi:hypothetical protein
VARPVNKTQGLGEAKTALGARKSERDSIRIELCWNAARSYGSHPGPGPEPDEAKAALEAQKARGAAFGLSYVGMLPEAMACPLAQAWELMRPKRPWRPETREGQHSDRAMLDTAQSLGSTLGPGPRANKAKASLEARKARGAAFELSYVGMLSRAVSTKSEKGSIRTELC